MKPTLTLLCTLVLALSFSACASSSKKACSSGSCDGKTMCKMKHK